VTFLKKKEPIIKTCLTETIDYFHHRELNEIAQPNYLCPLCLKKFGVCLKAAGGNQRLEKKTSSAPSYLLFHAGNYCRALIELAP